MDYACIENSIFKDLPCASRDNIYSQPRGLGKWKLFSSNISQCIFANSQLVQLFQTISTLSFQIMCRYLFLCITYRVKSLYKEEKAILPKCKGMMKVFSTPKSINNTQRKEMINFSAGTNMEILFHFHFLRLNWLSLTSQCLGLDLANNSG